MRSGKYIILMLLSCLPYVVNAQNKTDLLHRAQNAVTAVIVHDIFSPPVASRIYFYASLAGYEAAAARPGHNSFRALRADFPAPVPSAMQVKPDPEFSAIYATLHTASRFVFSDTAMLDSLGNILAAYPGITPAERQASEQWAKMVSDSVFSWAKNDNYLSTRKLRRYTLVKKPEAWKPTPPGYFAAVEPYWGRIRPVFIDSLPQYRPQPPIAFSSEKNSRFYEQAMEVYSASKKLTNSDSAVAMFWDCNPFFLNTQGHLNFATKKLSPGGHWMSIAGIASAKEGLSFTATLTTYLATAIALHDAFISCWDEKYSSNVIRPESYINSYIDESWRPLLQTPPFPEYTSGHSVISAACAAVLSSIFGERFSFRDNTEVPYGLPSRDFNSFWEAAEEAAVSRFYGGIHYRQAVEQGMLQGKKIGMLVAGKIKPVMPLK